MNYEVKSSKTISKKMKYKFGWIFYNYKDWVKPAIRLIVALNLAFLVISVIQFFLLGTIKGLTTEWNSYQISKWKVVDKCIEYDTYNKDNYYLILQNSKNKWEKEVDGVEYNFTKIGSIITEKYTKSDIFPDDRPMSSVKFSIVFFGIQVLIIIALIILISGFTEFGSTSYNRFSGLVMSENEELRNSDPRMREIFNRYVSLYEKLKKVSYFILVEYLSWCVYSLVIISEYIV